MLHQDTQWLSTCMKPPFSETMHSCITELSGHAAHFRELLTTDYDVTISSTSEDQNVPTNQLAD